MPNLDLGESKRIGSAEIPWEERYSRQLRFAPIGRAGQQRLSEASVLIVGVGALGASLAQHMVRAGVGTVRLADRDYVEPSNLQRQVLFDEEDARLALPKAVAAARRLQWINSSVHVDAHVTDVTAHTVMPLFDGIDLVLDGTDNAAARLLLSKVCYRKGIPFLYGGVAGSSGMSAMFIPGETGCLHCLIGGEAAENEGGMATCETLGVISPAVEFVASLQSAEALKWLTGDRDSIRPTLLQFDLWPFKVREMRLPQARLQCSVCGEQARGGNVGDQPAERVPAAASLCGRDTVQVSLPHTLDLNMWKQRLTAQGATVSSNPYLVRAELMDNRRLVLFPDGRVLVQGTSDPSEAVRLCEAYLTSKERVEELWES
ncbi:ThiF family adenylyltransferase [Paenibacillus abyssi]|uniref:Thiazole biosynthesis adenylyltransferase ThiF n=1 Tax=Paenibacillus abyssi TaxID=1340531 RepID=A0A917CW77_9BACL|nr:ThiF family adenylyltransferase [Paenibacillus abyssi]GGF98876.1 thiazole biosynthesis adenylyltransferase ThiF [Paenibacillus abyssi]